MNGFLKKSNTRVFVAPIPENIEITEVYPPERYAEITNVTNERVKREKYFVWRLLEYAIKKSRGANINDVTFKKCESGRWTAEGFDFSLSHSKGVAAVVISDVSCGIDIESICTPKSESFAKRILTEAEYAEFSSLTKENREEYLIKKWTQKEALFKARNLSAFIPSEPVEQSGELVRTESLIIGEKQYVCSVATLSEYNKADFVILGVEDTKF